jgi:hypothetical protein
LTYLCAGPFIGIRNPMKRRQCAGDRDGVRRGADEVARARNAKGSCGVAARANTDYLRAMDQPDLKSQPEPSETAEERVARLAKEDRLTEEAEAEAEREGTIPAEEVFAWLRSLDTDSPLPEPQPRKDDVWRQMKEARAAERAEEAKRQP